MSPEPIVGIANQIAGPSYSPPSTPAASYFGVAERLMPGLRVLAKEPAGLSMLLLTTHALECLLKAFITHHTGDERLVMQSDYRHNLNALWSKAIELGLATPAPHWLAYLSDVHDRPYLARYAKGLDGFLYIDGQEQLSGVEQLTAAIRPTIK